MPATITLELTPQEVEALRATAKLAKTGLEALSRRADRAKSHAESVGRTDEWAEARGHLSRSHRILAKLPE